MRAIDAEPLIETCKKNIAKLSEWERESGLNYNIFKRAYYIAMDLLYTAETLTDVCRQEYDKQIEEGKMIITDQKENDDEEVPIVHVGYDTAQMGREK